jgi:hypothetical protein
LVQVCINGKYFLLHRDEVGGLHWGKRFGVFDSELLPGIELADADTIPVEVKAILKAA